MYENFEFDGVNDTEALRTALSQFGDKDFPDSARDNIQYGRITVAKNNYMARCKLPDFAVL